MKPGLKERLRVTSCDVGSESNGRPTVHGLVSPFVVVNEVRDPYCRSRPFTTVMPQPLRHKAEPSYFLGRGLTVR